MNYDKLVFKLRKNAFNYTGYKSIQFNRILIEAKKRKLKQYEDTKEFKKRYAIKQNRLLFQTR